MTMEKKNQNTTYSGQTPPNNVDIENAVIGACLVESTAINEVTDILTPEMFYTSRNEIIYGAIEELHSAGKKTDMILVMQQLISNGKLEKIGGVLVLTQLAASVSSTVNIREHAMLIHQLYLARCLIISSTGIIQKAYDPQSDIADTIDVALKEIENIADGTCYDNPSESLFDTGKKALELYGQRKAAAYSGIHFGIQTGLKDLDVITNGGWKSGQLIILAARPAMGKTALMIHFAKAAAKSGVPVLIFSLEMDAQGITNRMLMSECDINSFRFSSGKLNDDEEAGLSTAYDRISASPVEINDAASISAHQIKNIARSAKRKGKCGLILIDYLQLIDMRQQNRSYNREQEVSQTSRAVKIMAKELEVPVILLSQLSRNVEARSDKTPILSDLRESGAIEQDADMVIFIHRPEYYDKEKEKGCGVLRIAKQRDGATADIAFKYNDKLTKIMGYNHDEKLPF